MKDSVIFVFGSNLIGHHGAGAARDALQHWGAEYGIGIGLTGQSWAIPTKNEFLDTLPLNAISWYIRAFLAYASTHPELDFQVTAVGCGLAGLDKADIIPMFQHAAKNVHLPIGWRWKQP